MHICLFEIIKSLLKILKLENFCLFAEPLTVEQIIYIYIYFLIIKVF